MLFKTHGIGKFVVFVLRGILFTHRVLHHYSVQPLHNSVSISFFFIVCIYQPIDKSSVTYIKPKNKFSSHLCDIAAREPEHPVAGEYEWSHPTGWYCLFFSSLWEAELLDIVLFGKAEGLFEIEDGAMRRGVV